MALPDDFDPTHALDGWRAPAPAPLDLELRSLQHGSQRGGPDEAKTARLKARGYEMRDVEDIEVPEVGAPRLMAEPPVLDIKVAPPRPDVAAPTLDLRAAAPQLARDPRLLARPEPQAWMALARRLAGASAEVLQAAAGLQVQNHAPQWLCALWPPRAEGLPWLGRWPALAGVAEGETRAQALQTLLIELPGEAALWEADLEDEMAMDWGLVAELVLRQGAGLRPAQTRALAELVEAERDARLARLAGGYAGEGRLARRKP